MVGKQSRPRTLYDKIFESKIVHERGDGSVLLYIDRHLIYEVTSPQAFDGLRKAGRTVRSVHKTLATLDHNVPTTSRDQYRGIRSFIKDEESRIQCLTLEKNVADFGLKHFGLGDHRQGIVHVIGPEQGFTLPGATIVCGDSHTSTHGAFGALAFGIGTSEVEHVLATQTLITQRSKNMKVQIDGEMQVGVTSKDLILHIIGLIGTAGGTGTVIEYCGPVVRSLSMAARMSMCNMSVEAGARAGMIAPDDVTFQYLENRPFAPKGSEWLKAVEFWRTLASDEGCKYDIEVILNADDVAPTVSWGTSPQDVIPISGKVPNPMDFDDNFRRKAVQLALEYMDLTPGTNMEDIIIDTVFIGSCTNSRLEDLISAARILEGRKISSNIKLAIVVPGSGLVKRQAERLGIDKIFKDAGYEWREAGCSMCVAMNPDVQDPGDRCASTSNRNFEDRQGARVKTHLMSPAMAAAASIAGKLADVRKYPSLERRKDKPKMLITSEVLDLEREIVHTKETPHSVAKAYGNDPREAKHSANEPFLKLKGVAAHMDKSNIDTDYIIPKQFCKTIQKVGLGKALFHYSRTNADGSENTDFVLNTPPFRQSRILVSTGPNFGCGSSREHAVWALLDFGITCIIAPSYADIFFNNCFKSGVLPIIIKSPTDLEKLADVAKSGQQLEIDLPSQVISDECGKPLCLFDIDPFRKSCLVNGVDDIAMTLLVEDKISHYEEKMKVETPWLCGNEGWRSLTTYEEVGLAQDLPQPNIRTVDLAW